MTPNQLRAWRKRQFISQRNLAEILGVHLNTVSFWERGKSRMPPTLELALEAIDERRYQQVRKLRAAKEIIAHERRLKMIDQHPERYASAAKNVAKARAVLAANRAAKKANAS